MKAILALFAAGLGLWLVFNLIGALIVGAIARQILPGKENISWFTTILVGFLGGMVGKFLFWILHWPTTFIMGFVASVVGAFLLLFIHSMMVANKSGASKSA